MYTKSLPGFLKWHPISNHAFMLSSPLLFDHSECCLVPKLHTLSCEMEWPLMSPDTMSSWVWHMGWMIQGIWRLCMSRIPCCPSKGAGWHQKVLGCWMLAWRTFCSAHRGSPCKHSTARYHPAPLLRQQGTHDMHSLHIPWIIHPICQTQELLNKRIPSNLQCLPNLPSPLRQQAHKLH